MIKACNGVIFGSDAIPVTVRVERGGLIGAVTEQIQLKRHHAELVMNCDHQRIAAIKFIRKEYDIGLKGAKDVCDAIWEIGMTRIGFSQI
jgi:ribosomal protein L7/L12